MDFICVSAQIITDMFGQTEYPCFWELSELLWAYNMVVDHFDNHSSSIICILSSYCISNIFLMGMKWIIIISLILYSLFLFPRRWVSSCAPWASTTQPAFILLLVNFLVGIASWIHSVKCFLVLRTTAQCWKHLKSLKRTPGVWLDRRLTTWCVSYLTFLCPLMMVPVTLPIISWATVSIMDSGPQFNQIERPLLQYLWIGRKARQLSLRKEFGRSCSMVSLAGHISGCIRSLSTQTHGQSAFARWHQKILLTSARRAMWYKSWTASCKRKHMMVQNLQPHWIGPKWWQMMRDSQGNNNFAFWLNLMKLPLEST